MTHEAAARAVGRSRSATTNLLRLLNLSEPVQQMLLVGDLEMGHARALLALDGARQIIEANEIVARKLSVRDAERRVGRLAAPASAGAAAARAKSQKGRDIDRIEQQLSDALSAPVEVRVKKRTSKGEAGEIAIALRLARRAQRPARATRPRAAVACAPRRASNFRTCSHANFAMSASTETNFGTLLANLRRVCNEQCRECPASRPFAWSTMTEA